MFGTEVPNVFLQHVCSPMWQEQPLGMPSKQHMLTVYGA